MLDSEERERRAALVITTLVKFYVLVELSGADCPLCRAALHDSDCPLPLAWSLLDPEQQEEARRGLRALALDAGLADERTDSSVH
jgi:hypothetical protein